MASFNEQYFLEPAIQQKILDFNNLTQGNNLVGEYAKKFMKVERFSLGSMENEIARCSKFFRGLRFELREMIVSIPSNSLIEIISATTNHVLIMEQEKVAKKNNFTPKSYFPTPFVTKPSTQ